MIKWIIIILILIWLCPTLFLWGAITKGGRGSSRWWSNLIAAATWPIAWMFAKYLVRKFPQLRKK